MRYFEICGVEKLEVDIVLMKMFTHWCKCSSLLCHLGGEILEDHFVAIYFPNSSLFIDRIFSFMVQLWKLAITALSQLPS